MSEVRRTALVTGASAGIGAAIARAYARRNVDLILTARREAPLAALSEEIERDFDVKATVLTADLADPAAPEALAQQIAARGLSVDILVNNAGFSRTTGFLSTAPAMHQAMMEVMALAPIRLSHQFAPGMVQRGYGRILNVASIAGLLPATGGDTLYGPIKSFLIKASQGLRMELAGTGVNVTALNPGYTLTEFHDVNGSREQVASAYPAWMWMTAARVAEIGVEAVEKNRAQVIPGALNTLMAGVARLLPEAVLLRQAAKHARRLERI